MLTFDAPSHTYRFNGEIVPSVTKIIMTVGLIDDTWFSSEAALRGTYVHEATVLSDRCELDTDSLDPRISGYVEAWRAFVRESGYQCQRYELPVYNAAYGFAGTIDRDGQMPRDGAIVDIKTGEPAPWHALQTALYAMCINEYRRRFAVYLREDGTFRVDEFKAVEDYEIAACAVSLAKWKLRNT